MEAIAKLLKSGLTRKQIALTIGLETPHLIGLYQRGQRFPSQKNYRAIVDLADSRGILLLARDFLVDERPTEAPTKPKSSSEARFRVRLPASVSPTANHKTS